MDNHFSICRVSWISNGSILTGLDELLWYSLNLKISETVHAVHMVDGMSNELNDDRGACSTNQNREVFEVMSTPIHPSRSNMTSYWKPWWLRVFTKAPALLKGDMTYSDRTSPIETEVFLCFNLCIYVPQFCDILRVNVGTYPSTMEHMGMVWKPKNCQIVIQKNWCEPVALACFQTIPSWPNLPRVLEHGTKRNHSHVNVEFHGNTTYKGPQQRLVSHRKQNLRPQRRDSAMMLSTRGFFNIESQLRPLAPRLPSYSYVSSTSKKLVVEVVIKNNCPKNNKNNPKSILWSL